MVKFRESIYIGSYTGGRNKLQQVVDSLKDDFRTGSYNVIIKNCNNFSDALIESLLPNAKVPSFVNRFAYIGSFVPCLFGSSSLQAGDRQEKQENIAFKGKAYRLNNSSSLRKRNIARNSEAETENIRAARLKAFHLQK